jgi:hypothetical protein
MKKLFFIFALVLFATGVNAQQQPPQRRQMDPATFAKERIAEIAKYVTVTKDDSTKLQKVYDDFLKESTTARGDRDKFMKLLEDLQKKIEGVLGAEKYKTYRTKFQADPENQRRMRPAGGNQR